MPKTRKKTNKKRIKRYKTRKTKYKRKKGKSKSMKGGSQGPTIDMISSDLEDLRNKIKESASNEETLTKLMGWATKTPSLSETTYVPTAEPALPSLEPEPALEPKQASMDENRVELGTLSCNFNFLWMTCSVFTGALAAGTSKWHPDRPDSKCAVCGRTAGDHKSPFTSDNLDRCLNTLNTVWSPGVPSNINLHFWYDSRYDNPPSVGNDGIVLHDLSDTKYNYTDFTIAGVYYKVDFAKLVILLYQMQNQTDDYSCFLDIDMDIKKVLSANVINIDVLGYAMNYGLGIKDFENQFIMVKKNVSDVSLALKALIDHVNGKYNFLSSKYKPENLRPEHQGIFDCHKHIYYILYSLKRLAQQGVELDKTNDNLIELLQITLRQWDNDARGYNCSSAKITDLRASLKIYEIYSKKDLFLKATLNGKKLFEELLTKTVESYKDLKIYRDITPPARKLLNKLLDDPRNQGKVLNLDNLDRPFSIEDFVKFLDDKGIKRGEIGNWDDPVSDFHDEFYYITVDVGIYPSRFDVLMFDA